MKKISDYFSRSELKEKISMLENSLKEKEKYQIQLEIEQNRNKNLFQEFNNLKEKEKEYKTQLQAIPRLEKELIEQKNSLNECLKNYTLTTDELTNKTQELTELMETVGGLEEKIVELKKPLNVDTINTMMGDIADTNYAKIKEKLLSFYAKEAQNLVSQYDDEGKELTQELAKLGVPSNHSYLPISISLTYDRPKKLIFDLDKPEIYNAEQRQGVYLVKFKAPDNKGKLEITYSINPSNQFLGQLKEDSKDFARASMYGYALKLMNENKLEDMAEFVIDNKLQDLMMPFIARNMDSPNAIYFKPIVDSIKE